MFTFGKLLFFIPLPCLPPGCQNRGMLYYTVVFLLVALLAGVLGFGALAGLAATIAKILFIIFLIFFILSLLRRKG